MNWRLVVLGLAVAALAGYLFLWDAPKLREREDELERGLLFFPTETASIDTLAVERNDLPYRIVRRSDGWWITDPIEVRADDFNVEETLTLLTSTERWRWVANDVADTGWAMFALAPDSPGRRRIILSGPEGRWALDVGNSVNGRELRYVRRVGTDDLEIADPTIDGVADGRHHGYRLSDLFSVVDSALVDIRFEVDGRGWSATRDERGRWWTEDLGSRQRLRRGDLDDIALGIAEARVRGFLRDSLDAADWSGYGLDQPWARVNWSSREGRTGQVVLGNEMDERVYFGRRDDESSVFAIAPGFLRALEIDVADLVDRNPIEDNVRRAQRLQVTLADQRLAVLTRDGLGYQVTIPTGGVPQADALDLAAYNTFRMVEDFQPMQSMTLLQGGAEVFDELLARIEIDWEDNHVELSVGWWGKREEPWIHVDGQDSIHQIRREFALQLRTLVELAHAPQ